MCNEYGIREEGDCLLIIICNVSGKMVTQTYSYPDSKVHWANMGPTWVLSAPDGPHIGPMNFAIKVASDKYIPI